MPQRQTKDLVAFKSALKAGKSLKQAKIAAGYSHHTARTGTHQLAKPFKSVWMKQQQKLISLAISHSPADQENVVRGALLQNVYEGKDVSVQSAKLLGQDKRVNMFQQDVSAGLIVIQMQGEMNQATDKPVIDLPMVEE